MNKTIFTVMGITILAAGVFGFLLSTNVQAEELSFETAVPIIHQQTDPEACAECLAEFDEDVQEANEELSECSADAEDAEELQECQDEFNEDVQEAQAERDECSAENSCQSVY